MRLAVFSDIHGNLTAFEAVLADFEAQGGEGLSPAAFYWAYVRDYVGYLATEAWWVFAIGAALFLCGIGVFAVRQRKERGTGFLAVLYYAWTHRKEREPGQGFFEVRD